MEVGDKLNPQRSYRKGFALKCLIKIFRGEGVVDGVGGSSERCLKWGGGGWGVIKGSFQKHLKIGSG